MGGATTKPRPSCYMCQILAMLYNGSKKVVVFFTARAVKSGIAFYVWNCLSDFFFIIIIINVYLYMFFYYLYNCTNYLFFLLYVLLFWGSFAKAKQA